MEHAEYGAGRTCIISAGPLWRLGIVGFDKSDPVVRKNSILITCPASSAVRPTYTPPRAECNTALDNGSPSSEITDPNLKVLSGRGCVIHSHA